MQYCTRCGRESFSTDKYCLNCGQNLSSTPEASNVALPVPLSPPLTDEPSAESANYCPNCGAPLAAGQNFCPRCGFDLRWHLQSRQTMGAPSVVVARGLSRNALVYFTREGLRGVKLRSEALLALALILPLPLAMAAYYIVQLGALDLYIIIWIAVSGLLYDALKWRAVTHAETSPPDSPKARESWQVGWSSIRMADWNGRTLWVFSTNPVRKVSVTFDSKDAPIIEQSLMSWGVKYAWKPPRFSRAISGFWPLVLLVFVAGQVILILAATLPFFPGEEQTYAAVLSNTAGQISGATFTTQFKDIFLNNVQVAWGGMVPLFGQLTFGIANYNTGRVIQVIAMGDQVQPSVILLSLYLLPHTWVEESAYPIATVAGLFAITRWRSVSPGEFSRKLSRGSTKLALAMGGVAIILLTAGFIETIGLYLGFGEILLWVPLLLGYYLFTVAVKRQRREQSSMSSA